MAEQAMSITIQSGLSQSAKPHMFPNVAGQAGIDDALAAELEASGIEVLRFDFLRNGRSEVDTAVRGALHGWRFERAWYYWRANGPGLPPEYATSLHAMHGQEVRVDGHCGCPSPLEWHKGFAVGAYHVDTPRGLKALADALRLCVSQATGPQNVGAAVVTDQSTTTPPIDMLLWCPSCHTQHVDEPDERTLGWVNPPHRSHLCHSCGTIWRPADVATNGIQQIATRGRADTWPR